MAKRHRRWLGLITLLGIVWGVSFACYLGDQYETEGDAEWRYYAINPETLLEMLDQGDPNAFTLLEATPTPIPSPPALSVHWNQADYYRIAQVIHEQAWTIPLDAHNLYDVSFRMNCSDAEEGVFNFAEFKSNDIIKTGDNETRLEHWTTVTPGKDIVVTVAVEYRPNIFYKKPIDLAQYQIAADEGVQIAESNGGSTARMRAGNDCRISIFTTENGDEKWRITYVHFRNESDHIGNTIYDIEIDPRTGKYNVIYPKPK